MATRLSLLRKALCAKFLPAKGAGSVSSFSSRDSVFVLYTEAATYFIN